MSLLGRLFRQPLYEVCLEIHGPDGLISRAQPSLIGGEGPARKLATELAACNRWGDAQAWPKVTLAPVTVHVDEKASR